MTDQEFQTKVLGSVETIEKRNAELLSNFDRLQGETKKAIEDLTVLKNHANDATATMSALKRTQEQLRNERSIAGWDPIKRIASNPDYKEAINHIVRSAANRQTSGADLIQKAGAVISTGTPGSTMIIGQLSSEIYDVLASYGVWSTFQVEQLSTKTTTFPVSTARPVAAAITSEGGQLSEDSTMDGTSVDATTVPIACLLYASINMLQDSEYDITSFVMNNMAEAFAYRQDWMCLGADGTSDATDGGMTGIFSGGTAASAGTGNTSLATLEYEDVLRCLTTVASPVLRRPARWWMHPTVLVTGIMGIKDGNERPLFQTALEAPSFGAIGSMLGYPIILADAAPSTDSAGSVVAAFGDPKGQIAGVRMAFEFMSSDEYKFDYLRRYFRCVGRFGNKIRAATAFAKLTLAAA